MSHTKGPWVAVREDKQYFNSDTGEPSFTLSSYSISAEGVSVATAFKYLPNGDMKSNAHLIAAAPDLLHTCEMMLERLEDPKMAALWESPEEHEIEIEIYRSMIAKARGES